MHHSMLLPRLQVREFVNVNARPSCSGNPTPACHISDGAAIADQVSGWRVLQLHLHRTVQATNLTPVTVDAILDLLEIGIGRSNPYQDVAAIL